MIKRDLIHLESGLLPGIFLGCALIAGRLWKGDILIADMEELKNLDALEIYPRRINANEVLVTQKGDELKFPFADGAAKLSGRGYECSFFWFARTHFRMQRPFLLAG